jgi:hypothetical protein
MKGRRTQSLMERNRGSEFRLITCLEATQNKGGESDKCTSRNSIYIIISAQ